AINTDVDDRWRNTSAWRSFLNLPSSNVSSRHHAAVNGVAAGKPITDPVVWLDYHRDLKSTLHDARLQITKRDQATSAQAQHESSTAAKKHLVKADSAIQSLEQGLQSLGNDSWGRERLGDGEMRRRRDLVESAKKEREGLENLLNAMATKSSLDGAIAQATAGDKEKLINAASQQGSKKPAAGRVLGKETDRTRALDNQGVLQLQQQLMKEQDEDVDVLAAAVARQKQIGIEIQEELAVQKDMLELMDEDVDRVQSKLDVARKRIGKIK
ncbi:MAG: hypothetical protein Q9218_002571, partial [Villophora microphyllina]